MQQIYAAHIQDDGSIQTILEHLEGTATLARRYAERFGCGDYGYLCGMLHDIGKYSQQFQRRIRGAKLRADHSLAGAIECNRMLPRLGWLMAYCIAGHHAGLPDGGSRVDTGIESTLHGRLQRENIPNYAAYKDEMALDALMPKVPAPIRPLGKYGFSLSFFTRMLYSCLVDADFLDTEQFMSNGTIERSIDCSMDNLYTRMLHYIAAFGEPTSEINKKRSEILHCCIEKASLPKGLFTLTVSTGGGKTISSMAFALRHAKEHNMDRIIYVIPYTSIIEQNAAVFKEILGAENVLEHHANFNYDDEDESMSRSRYATENWDMPIVVTTNVQFFESLFAHKSSKCRKLHNIANSVIIFDEAQMLPTEYLLPCVQAISELTYNYGCTAILCSATQPSLQGLFPKELPSQEICENVASLYDYFKRTNIISIGPIEDVQLAERLNSTKQALCIVNTRRQAQALYHLLDSNGSFHLSTLMCPISRKDVLSTIKNRLKQDLPCRVISTSLIEAGVDIDFPVVYRAMSGLDSQIQAAGRCNREGKRACAVSNVYIFEASDEYKKRQPSALRRPIEVARSITRQFADVSSPDAIAAYFTLLYQFEGDGLDTKQIVPRLEDGAEFGLSFPFVQIDAAFKLIDDITRCVIIPLDDQAKSLVLRLQSGERNKKLLRNIQPYTVNIYEQDYEMLYGAGILQPLDSEIAILTDRTRYSDQTGLNANAESGVGIFVG